MAANAPGATGSKAKTIAGNICPLAIPTLRFELDRDPFEAVRVVAEICALLSQFRQLSELWYYQVQARECVRGHLAKERAAAEADVSDRLLLTAAVAKLEQCNRLYQLCDDLGIFEDVAYNQRLQPLGSSWVADEWPIPINSAQPLPRHRYSTLSARVAGTGIWKRYMRKRIQQYKREEDAELAKIVDTRFCIPLQAFCRRFVAAQRNCCLAAACRRLLAQETYKHLPLQYRVAASRIQASLRRVYLLRRYTFLRNACVNHGVERLNDWKKLSAATQLALYQDLQKGLDPKEPELDDFQRFLQEQNEETARKPFVASLPPTEMHDEPLSSAELILEEEETTQMTNFRNQDPGANTTGEQIVGRDVHPEEGMRVIFATAALEEFPELLADSGGGMGTITWVDPEDADGDGITGDICEVLWDKTELRGDYRTGFEGQFRLAAVASKRVRAQEDDGSEKIIGLDVEPLEGMRVVLCNAAIDEFPELLEECGGTPEEPGLGIITWVDPEDADGDGIVGDICAVRWQRTGITGDYRTGFEGDFRLALSMGNRKKKDKDGDETLVGLDVYPLVGMRVVLAKEALQDTPGLLEDCGSSSSGMLGAGIITWIDEEDLDGDGHTGDVCEVEWERTGLKRKYHTGLDGNFRLAETALLQHEISGMKLQSVFRGHVTRRTLRNALIAKYLVEEQAEESYNRFVSALQVQCAARGRQARLRLTFERKLAHVYAVERAVGPDPHIAVPLRLQSVFRGHVSRGKLRSAILSCFMIRTNLQLAWEEESNTRAYIERAYFVLHTHSRLRSWRNHTIRMLAHVRLHASIQKRFETGVVWHAFCFWLQHSLDAKDRVDFVSLLIHRSWKHLVYTRLMKIAMHHWSHHTRNLIWLTETQQLVSNCHDRYLARLKYQKAAQFALISRKQRLAAFALRARITFRMCVKTLREWHICVWRRDVIRNVGDLMLPCWIEFLIWRCFCGLKFNGIKGEMILARAEISKFTLQQKFSNVSKLSKSALIRFTKKRTGVKGPTRPLPQFREEQTAARKLAALHDNDALYRPMLLEKTFPYPISSSASGAGSNDQSQNSWVSTPAFGSARSVMGHQKKTKKKTFKTKDEIERSFWDARSKVLLASDLSSNRQKLEVQLEPQAYKSTLPDLTRRPTWQTGAEILAEKFNIEPKVLTSLESFESGDALPRSVCSRDKPLLARRKIAWQSTFTGTSSNHPDMSQACAVAAGSPLERGQLKSILQPRSSTAFGRLELLDDSDRLPPLCETGNLLR